MIHLTKTQYDRKPVVVVRTDDEDETFVFGGHEGHRALTMSLKSWDELRRLTPEALALKELVAALDKRLAHCIADDQPPYLSPFLSGDHEVVSALQEARALVGNLADEEEDEEDEEDEATIWRIEDTLGNPLGTMTSREPTRGDLIQVGDVAWRAVEIHHQPVQVVVVEKVEATHHG